LVSYNVPPYGRAGLYLELTNLKELVDEYRISDRKDVDAILCQNIFDYAQRSGMVTDVALYQIAGDKTTAFTGTDLPIELCKDVAFADWIQRLSDYLNVLQNRLFSSGLRYFTDKACLMLILLSDVSRIKALNFCINRVLGAEPTDHELNSYLEAYFGDRLDLDHRERVISNLRKAQANEFELSWFDSFVSFFQDLFVTNESNTSAKSIEQELLDEASSIALGLSRCTEELTSVLEGLNGGYIKPAPGGGKNAF
jgi:magnesium chelatase subunit H